MSASWKAATIISSSLNPRFLYREKALEKALPANILQKRS
jgi:hypothetical protein